MKVYYLEKCNFSCYASKEFREGTNSPIALAQHNNVALQIYLLISIQSSKTFTYQFNAYDSYSCRG